MTAELAPHCTFASGAFLDCTALCRLLKLPGQHEWRGIYAEENAFAV